MRVNLKKTRREEINNRISKTLSKDSFSGNNLSLQYQYYCVLLDNLTLEHKKKSNINNMRKKDFQINKLVNQIKLRDELIENANHEMKKRKINLDRSDEIKEIDELNIEQSMVLPMIVDKSMIINKENINHMKTNSTSNSKSHYNLPLLNNYEPKSSSRNNSPTLSPKGYNYGGYSNPLVNKPLKTFKTKTNNIIQLLKQKQLSNLRLNIINGNYANSKLQYIGESKNNRTHTQGNNYNQIDLSFDNSTESGNNSFSIADREIQKKAKNILRTNLLSRYKNSPYIKK